MNNSDWEDIKKLFHGALELSTGERLSFLEKACNGNARIRRQVDSLLLAHDRAGDFIVDSALVEAGVVAEVTQAIPELSTLIGDRIGSYKILRELGKGGMGAVFLAERADDAFAKQVAIKIVKRGMDTESILRRFVMERQILANLEHENIARFLDGGTTTDGLPYFVMEYVEGQPITKYCNANKLGTNDRLRLFQKVCAAVQYAHQNLVVHRDLKPGNILLTRDGSPKLLDFGVAKLLNPEWVGEATEPTRTALRLMTPEYASPEQLRGLPITTATDVYSLGVVLYELLSGQRPFHFHSRLPEEIIRVLLSEEPERPSTAATVKHRATETGPASSQQSSIHQAKVLRGDLDNIVLRAMRKERDRRYASVQELAEDIRRYLVGLPVNARADTFRYRAEKFLLRHRLGAAAATLVLVTLLSASVITSWEAHIARSEREKSERRFAEQRKLANSLMTEVQNSLNNVPNASATQRILAQKSLEYLNNLAKDSPDDSALLGELATAYTNVAYFQAWTLQDNPSALLSNQKAIDLDHRRIALSSNDLAAKRALGEALGQRIESLLHMAQIEKALAAYDEALSLQESILAVEPSDAVQMMRVAETGQGLGETLGSKQRQTEADQRFRNAIGLADKAVSLFKNRARQPDELVEFSLMKMKEGSIYEDLKDWQKAADCYRDAGLVAESVHRDHPDILQALRNTTASHWYLGQVMDRLGDLQAALESFRVSLKSITDATAGDQSVDPTHYAEAKYSVIVGRALCKVGKIDEGVLLLRHGIGLVSNWSTIDRSNSSSLYYGPELLQWGVEGLRLAGLKSEANATALRAIEMVAHAAQTSPDDPDPRLRLIFLYQQLGDLNSDYDPDAKKFKSASRKDLMEARRWYQKGVDSLHEISKQFSISPDGLSGRIDPLNERLALLDSKLR